MRGTGIEIEIVGLLFMKAVPASGLEQELEAEDSVPQPQILLWCILIGRDRQGSSKAVAVAVAVAVVEAILPTIIIPHLNQDRSW
jgi:hypothetical protein